MFKGDNSFEVTTGKHYEIDKEIEGLLDLSSDLFDRIEF